MRKWTKPDKDQKEIAVLLFPKFSNHCLANAIEPFRAVNEILDLDLYSWTFLTLNGLSVESSSGLPVLPSMSFKDHPGGDYLFVLTSYDVQKLATVQTRRALVEAAKRYKTVVAMDTASWLLAHAGLLENRHATIHWNELIAFSEQFPQVIPSSDRFVQDGSILTCGGAMTAFDTVLHMLKQTHGEALRLEVSQFFLKDTPDTGTAPLIGRHTSGIVKACISIMSQNIEDPMPIADLAQHADVSQKTLTRHFQAELGASPITVYKRLRLGVARDLARRDGYSVSEIAVRSGYRNASALTRAFVEEYGKPPSAYRENRN